MVAVLTITAQVAMARAVRQRISCLVFCDYGGNVEFSMSHRFFLAAPNAFYVIVLSLTRPSGTMYARNAAIKQQLVKWLTIVRDASCALNGAEKSRVCLFFNRENTMQKVPLGERLDCDEYARELWDEAHRLFGSEVVLVMYTVGDCRKMRRLECCGRGNSVVGILRLLYRELERTSIARHHHNPTVIDAVTKLVDAQTRRRIIPLVELQACCERAGCVQGASDDIISHLHETDVTPPGQKTS